MNFREHVRMEAAPPSCGIEIGPSYRPILPKREGFNTTIIDHASAPELMQKYIRHGEDVSTIEDVDVVWRGGDLSEQFSGKRFDWIVASHVIEHVPDIIGFFQSCERLLVTGGGLYLAIPDKRRTFDFVKPHLEVGLALQRHLEKRNRHDFATVFAAYNDHVLVDGRGDWGSLPIENIQLAANPLEAIHIAEAAVAKKEYFDCHANYLTPAALELLLLELRQLSYINLETEYVSESVGCEFYAKLKNRPGKNVILPLIEYQEAKTALRLALFEEISDQIDRLRSSPIWGRVLKRRG